MGFQVSFLYKIMLISLDDKIFVTRVDLPPNLRFFRL